MRARATRGARIAGAVTLLFAARFDRVSAQDFHLFDPGPADSAVDDLQRAGVPSGFGSPNAGSPTTPPADLPLPRRCVVIQCETLPIAPAPGLFTTGTTLWTGTGLFLGALVGSLGPIDYGLHDFRFTDEGFFGYETYGGGSDKASHAVISATISGVLYDAYRLNGLTENQSLALSFATALGAGAMVEIGDGLTPYGFSAQDLIADAFGSLAGALVKRGGFDDVVSFSIGKVPTNMPDALVEDRTLVGIDYTHEIYAVNLQAGGIASHLAASRKPGPERFLQASFVYLTKGYGYVPVLETRYQEIGVELGLNIPEVLRAVGVTDATWWGDVLLRAFTFLRIPYTQLGAYYNFKTRTWYGPVAPNRFY